MSSSCMGKELPKEKKWGIKNCRELKCSELRKNEDTAYPEDSQERCQVFNTMPGTLPCCIKDPAMPPEEILRHALWVLHTDWEKKLINRKTPGPKNCPKTCPYKISEQGEVFGKSGAGRYEKKPGTIWKCAFTGAVLGTGLAGSCPCHVLDNPDQEKQIDLLKTIIKIRQKMTAEELLGNCRLQPCPDGISRCRGEGNTDCPIIRVPFKKLAECPLWRIPAKMLPAPSPNVEKEVRDPALEKPKNDTKGESASRKTAPKKKPEPAKKSAKKGRRAWTTELCLQTVHLGDMEKLGEQIPDQAVDMVFTDPPYIDDLWEDAYRGLADLAARVLKPYGFLITYAPQAHLDEIIFILNHAGDRWVHGQLNYFWIISSINAGATCKAHKWNALCLHKPILVYQLIPDQGKIKGARRCFADVIKGRKQKAFHPWQQSVHDVLGIIDRFMVPGEILLDPFAGTGTSLKAANLLGMDWIGFEIDPKTHAIAVRELQQQPITLFSFDEPTGPEPGDPAEEARPVELSSTCLDCQARDKCKSHDPLAETVTPGYPTSIGGPICKSCGWPETPEPEKESSCITCGHHKGRKTFHESCPRLRSLMFKGGDLSASELMNITIHLPCGHWIPKPDPRCKGCGDYDDCKTHDPEKENCVAKALKVPGKQPAKKAVKTGDSEKFNEAGEANVAAMGLKKDTAQWFAALTTCKRHSCPGWSWEIWKIDPKKKGEWLYEGGRTEKEANAIKKQLESDEFHIGSRFEVRERPELCEEQNSMGGCMNGGWNCHDNTPEQRKAVGCFVPVRSQSEKKSASKKSKKESEKP